MKKKIGILFLLISVVPSFSAEKITYCKRRREKVFIDGNLKEWKNANIIDLEKEGKINVERKSKTDLSAIAYTLWDNKNFYFGLIVNDDIHCNKNKDSSIWEGDSIQFAFDVSPDNTNDIFNDYEFGMALTENGPIVWRWYPSSKKIENVELKIRREWKKTIYELKMPFSEIGFKPRRGKKLGFTFTVNENDGKGFKGWMEWTPGICGYKDSILFGKLILK